MWQDLLLATGSLAAAAALLPTILGPTKPARATSALTAGLLCLFAVAYSSLGLWWAACFDLLSMACWMILLFQASEGWGA